MDEKDLQKYYEKSGDDFIYPDNLIKNEHGFMSWTVHEGKLVLLNVYGNGKYWDTFSVELAKQLNLKSVLFATKRNPKGFVKKFGYTLTGYILEKEV